MLGGTHARGNMLYDWVVAQLCRESETDLIFEYLVDDATGSWQHWANSVPQWIYPAAEERPKFAQLVIPTLDSVRCDTKCVLLPTFLPAAGHKHAHPRHRLYGHG